MHEQTIADITTENANLTSTLNAAEIRLHDLYTEQGRMEEDMATKLQLIEKLRTQIRDAEKEKRDSHRRYTEQVHFSSSDAVSGYLPLACADANV